ALAVPGFTLEPVKFTPHASESAPEPKHKDQECSGVHVKVGDAHAAKPYTLGVSLLALLRQNPQFARASDAALDRPRGPKKLREAREKGLTAEAIVAADEPAIDAFRKERREALLY